MKQNKKNILLIGIAAALIIVGALVFKPKTLSGTYKLTSPSFMTGEFVVGSIDGRKKTSGMDMRLDDLYSSSGGYIETVTKEDTFILYKYKISVSIGNLFDNSQSYIYLKYFPKNDYFIMEASDDIEFVFSKKK